MDHFTFISLSYVVSGAGLIFLAVKSYIDMKKADRAAADMRRARRSREGET